MDSKLFLHPMSFSRSKTAFFFAIPLLISCGNGNTSVAKDSSAGNDSAPVMQDSVPQMAFHKDMQIEVRTYAVKDSADKLKGYGYDLYVDGKKTIHQPIIPAVPGNDAFATEDDAKRTGDMAAAKMKATGSFPSLTIHELDSIGIKHH